MEYYLAIKRNEVLIITTIWIHLKNIMLSERHQSQKTTYYVIVQYEFKLETEGRLVVT